MTANLILATFALSLTGDIGGDYRPVTMEISAYCPCTRCCGPHARGITASGLPVKRGMVAAPKIIPFGTVVEIKGLGRFTVQDRGGAIKGNRLDVYYPTHKEALRFGVQRCEVRTISIKR
jgi:3D (Asp-Asp-Asp) domain-containing protein